MFRFKGEPVVDVSKIMPPREKLIFQDLELEGIFNLSALDSLSAWNSMTAEKLWVSIGRESVLSDKPESEIKERLIARMAAVEKGLSTIKNNYPDAVEQTLVRLRVLRNSLE